MAAVAVVVMTATWKAAGWEAHAEQGLSLQRTYAACMAGSGLQVRSARNSVLAEKGMLGEELDRSRLNWPSSSDNE